MSKGVIKDLEMGRLSWPIQGGPKCDHMCPYNKLGGGRFHTDRRGGGNGTTEADCCDLARNQEMPVTTRREKRQILL